MKNELTDLEVFELIKGSNFTYQFNMNDTFHWACGDYCKIDGDDLTDLIPVIKKHGYMAIIAYEAISRGYDPDDEMDIKGEEFENAKLDILNIVSESFYNLREKLKLRKEEIDFFGEEVQYQSDTKGIFLDSEYNRVCSFTAYLPKQKIGVSCSSSSLAKKKLIKVYKILKEDK
jgi:hypothetical protein